MPKEQLTQDSADEIATTVIILSVIIIAAILLHVLISMKAHKKIMNGMSNIGQRLPAVGVGRVGNAIANGTRGMANATMNGVSRMGNALANGTRGMANATMNGIRSVGNLMRRPGSAETSQGPEMEILPQSQQLSSF